MKSRITSLGLPAALLSVSLFAACQNTARGVEQDTEKNTAEARQEAREAGNAAERAGDRIAGETKEAGQSVGDTLDAAAQTMQIKTALIDADNLDAGSIDVDTNGETRTVTLKGHVPTDAQKAAAERIAKEKAPDYRVVNRLEVRK
jgi:hyperosmotically inducible periplasmic protein